MVGYTEKLPRRPFLADAFFVVVSMGLYLMEAPLNGTRRQDASEIAIYRTKIQ